MRESREEESVQDEAYRVFTRTQAGRISDKMEYKILTGCYKSVSGDSWNSCSREIQEFFDDNPLH